VGEGVSAGKDRMVETLNAILANYNGPVKLLLENTAGQGTELGTTLAELVEIRQRTEYPAKIGFCFDTCHAFAAGAYHPDQLSSLVTEMKQSGYLEDLVVIHFNDSKCAYNSRRDRHAKIGQGEIGDAGLKEFLQTAEFQSLPVVLETPVQEEAEYAVEIEMLCDWQKRKECLK